MSNVIQFLESMGNNASLSTMSPDEYAAVVKTLDIDDAAQHALLNRDAEALHCTIGKYKQMMMILMPAEDDDQGEEKENDDDPKKEEEISLN